jgi:hypothetical protein
MALVAAIGYEIIFDAPSPPEEEGQKNQPLDPIADAHPTRKRRLDNTTLLFQLVPFSHKIVSC